MISTGWRQSFMLNESHGAPRRLTERTPPGPSHPDRGLARGPYLPKDCAAVTARAQLNRTGAGEWRRRGKGWLSGGAWHFCSNVRRYGMLFDFGLAMALLEFAPRSVSCT